MATAGCCQLKCNLYVLIGSLKWFQHIRASLMSDYSTGSLLHSQFDLRLPKDSLVGSSNSLILSSLNSCPHIWWSRRLECPSWGSNAGPRVLWSSEFVTRVPKHSVIPSIQQPLSMETNFLLSCARQICNQKIHLASKANIKQLRILFMNSL